MLKDYNVSDTLELIDLALNEGKKWKILLAKLMVIVLHKTIQVERENGKLLLAQLLLTVNRAFKMVNFVVYQQLPRVNPNALKYMIELTSMKHAMTWYSVQIVLL